VHEKWPWPALTEQPWVPLGVMVFLLILARTGRAAFKPSWASFPPSSGSTAMSIFYVECLCTQERLNREVVNNIWRGGSLPPSYSWQQP
jgi:hypothetical protein